MNGASIHLEHLSKHYDRLQAVDDLSLSVAPGEFLTILGPSGSGKTTVLKMVAGFDEPTSGRILIGDTDVTIRPTYERNLGMVFQNYALFPHLTIFENIAFPLTLRHVPKSEIAQRVKAALALVKLQGVEGRRPRQLSGGQQQRVALARALVYNPPVLLMDEPLGALDKQLRLHMQLELKQLQRQLGVTVINVTHDQEEALTMSDRILVMQAGRLEQVGSPRDLYERPANPFVASFIGEANLLQGVAAGPGAVQTQGGSVLNIPGLQVTGDLRVAIRPEKLHLVSGGGGGTNTLQGVVEEVVYVGETTRYRVRINPTESLVVKVPNRSGIETLVPGAPATLGWHPDDAVVVAS